MPSSFTRSRSGMALLNVILLVILIGGLVIAGYKLMGPIIQRGKINDTKTIINGNVDAIVSWTVANCRIPDTGTTNTPPTDFSHVVQNPNDAWGNQLSYLYAPELADSTKSCNQICGLKDTRFFVSGVNDSVAFVISSSQYSATFHNQFPAGTTLNGTVLASTTLVSTAGGSVVGTLNQIVADPPDILRVVTLNELKARIGCAGYTWGQLRILNNELPKACANASYTATIFADGGAPSYSYSFSGLPAGLTASGNTITGTANLPATVTVTVADSNSPAQSTQRTYNLNVVSCGAPVGDIPPGTIPDPPVQPPTNPGFNTTDPTLIEFGLDNNNTSACVWYPQNLPLQGKTMRAYWSFCYKASDVSTTSSTYADGYTFSLMQGSNPTSYCGTGSTYNVATNPFTDCSVMGGLGEYLAYCGLPGQSVAVEFDIYPSGNRGDTTGSYNHATIVKTTSTHRNAGTTGTAGTAGTYADNTHNVGGNPANATTCYPPLPACNGSCSGTNSCTGTCNGVAVINSTCIGTCVGRCSGATCTWATPVAGTTVGLQVNGICSGTNACTGTCDGVSVTSSTCNGTCYGACTGTYNGTALPGTGPGSLYNSYCGHNFTIPAGHPNATTWLEDGCTVGYDSHNTRVELHTRCNTDCSQCELNSCTTKSLIKVWIDKGNSVLTSDDATTPDLSYCSDLPTALNQYKVGFTEATGGAHQWGYIKNFTLKTAHNCPLATISPDTLPSGTVNAAYTATTLTATGGTPSYTWSAANLPPGLTINSASGVISGTPTTAGTYNTVLISVKDACTADTCDNTVSKSYTITIAAPPVPTCTLSVSPAIVPYNGTTGFTWTIANGPASGSWSTAPGGTCSNFTASSGGSCTSGALTTSGTTIYTLTVSNAGGSSSCSATVSVGCANYRVWNTTGNTYDFRVNGTCRNNIATNSEITNNTNRLNPGQNLIRLTNSGTCRGSTVGQISYNDAMNADISANGGDGLCDVNYTSSDTVTDR